MDWWIAWKLYQNSNSVKFHWASDHVVLQELHLRFGNSTLTHWSKFGMPCVQAESKFKQINHIEPTVVALDAVCKCNCVPPDCLPSSTARGESRNGPAQILDLHKIGIASKSGMPQHCLSLSSFGFPILTQPNVRPGDTAGLIAACSKDLPVAIQLNGIIERIAAPLTLILFPPVTGCHRMSQDVTAPRQWAPAGWRSESSSGIGWSCRAWLQPGFHHVQY